MPAVVHSFDEPYHRLPDCDVVFCSSGLLGHVALTNHAIDVSEQGRRRHLVTSRSDADSPLRCIP